MNKRNVIDFAAARRRIDALVALHNSTDIAEVECVAPQPTLIERLRKTLTDQQLAELVNDALEELK